jgi:TldD protein
LKVEDLAKFAVDAAVNLGAEYAEARYQRNDGVGLVVKNGVPDPAGFVRKSGIGVRVLVNGGLGFACTNLLSRDDVRGIVESAFRTAKLSSRLVRKPIRMAGVSNAEAKWQVNTRTPIEEVGIDEQLSLLDETEKALSSIDMSMKLVSRMLDLSTDTEEKLFLNSEGAFVRSVVPRIRYFILLTGASEKGMIQRWFTKGETAGWEVVKEWNMREVAVGEAKTMSEILAKGEKPPSQELDVVLGSEITGIVCHESCGHPQEADRILGREAAQAGESYLKPDMIGFRVGSEHVTVVDDPTMPRSYGYYEYDDEGVKTGKRVLIEKGRIANFLHNRETAAEMKTTSNASSRAVFFDREPIVRMANTYMEPSDFSFDELVENVGDGVFIKTFMEWNIDDRRYNQRYVGHEAYRIENGELKGLIRNPILELTTPALYGSVDAVGKEMEFEAATCGKGDPSQGAPVCHGGPPMRLRKIRLGGAL